MKKKDNEVSFEQREHQRRALIASRIGIPPMPDGQLENKRAEIPAGRGGIVG